MDAPQETLYRKVEPNPTADVRSAMSRRGDFNPSPEHYTNETSLFEILAVLEAPAIEDEALA